MNKQFNELLEADFVETNTLSPLITYYNDVLGSSTAFSTLSRKLESLLKAESNNDKDAYNQIFGELINQIRTFIIKAQGYNK